MKYRVKQVGDIFYPQWATWWLPGWWHAYNCDEYPSRICFNTLDEAKQCIAKEANRAQPIIHDVQ